MRKLILAFSALAAVPVLVWLGLYGVFSAQNVYQMTDPAAQATELMRSIGSMLLIVSCFPIVVFSAVAITDKDNWTRKP